jgi:hypothetical protein
MKPKSLANVLIKILGLSLIAHGIPGLLNGIIGWHQFSSGSHAWLIVLLDLVPFAVGFALIAGSRWFVEKLFKDEAE